VRLLDVEDRSFLGGFHTGHATHDKDGMLIISKNRRPNSDGLIDLIRVIFSLDSNTFLRCDYDPPKIVS